MATALQIAARTDRLRLLVTADSHLGRDSAGMSPARREARRARLRRSFGEVVDAAIREGVDLFLQAGDLFDSPDPANVERAFVAGELARLRAAGIPVLAIGGCHDTPGRRAAPGGETPQEVFARLGALTFLSHPQDATESPAAGITAAQIGWGDRVVTVGGLTWSPLLSAGRGPSGDPLRGLVWPPSGGSADLRILLIHYAVEGHGEPAAQEPVGGVASLDELIGVSLVVAGHSHRPGVFRSGTGPTVVIPGATERFTFENADDDPGCWLIELAESGEVVAIERRAVTSQPRHDLAVSADDLPAENPGAALRALLDPICQPDTLVRLRLSGPIRRDAYQALDWRHLIEYGRARAFAFKLETGGLYPVDERGLGAARGTRVSPLEEISRIAAACHETDPDPLWAVARDRILADLAGQTEGSR